MFLKAKSTTIIGGICRFYLDLDEGGVVVGVPEATLEAKHDAFDVQPYRLHVEEQSRTRKPKKGEM